MLIILIRCYFYYANNLYQDHHHVFLNHPREDERDNFATSQSLKKSLKLLKVLEVTLNVDDFDLRSYGSICAGLNPV